MKRKFSIGDKVLVDDCYVKGVFIITEFDESADFDYYCKSIGIVYIKDDGHYEDFESYPLRDCEAVLYTKLHKALS